MVRFFEVIEMFRMSYPVSLYDTTKINFTINWDSFRCPLRISTGRECSPMGGFAVVFQ